MRTKEEQRQRKLKKCKNFSGLINDHCAEGVAYAEVKVKQESGVFEHPCFFEGQHIECPKRVYPTADEIDREEEATRKSIERVIGTRNKIVEDTGGKIGVSGEIDCLFCDDGKVNYSVSGYNGHILAACTTPGCVYWIE
jgi:hypothetical protein